MPGGVLATPAAAAAEPDVTVECVLSPNPHRVTCVVPTFFPNTVEQVVNTRHSAANSERRGKLIQEVTVQYNLVHEPWLKYSVAAVADEGFKKSQYTAARLRRESLFLESHAARCVFHCFISQLVTFCPYIAIYRTDAYFSLVTGTS